VADLNRLTCFGQAKELFAGKSQFLVRLPTGEPKIMTNMTKTS
jgi:hypothetical protein